MKNLFKLFIVCLALFSNTHANQFGIVAKVGDEIITNYDLDSRVRLTMLAANIPPSDKKAYKKLSYQMLEALIKERLQTMEAKNLGIKVAPQEISNAVANIEKMNKMPQGKMQKLLEKASIPPSALFNQLIGEISWAKILRKKVKPNVIVDKSEIEAYLKSIGEEELQYSLQEIVVPVSDRKKAKASLTSIINLIENNKQSFESYARQLSVTPSASNGGDIGWVAKSKLPKEVAAALIGAGNNDIIGPVFIDDVAYIIKFKGIKDSNSIDEDEDLISIKSFIIPSDSKEDEVQDYIAKQARKIRQNYKGCYKFERFADYNKWPVSAKNSFMLNELADDEAQVLRNLSTGRVSAPLVVDGGYKLFMICEKIQQSFAKRQQQKHNQAKQEILRSKMAKEAKKYMRKLRDKHEVVIN